ncbi:hypothetical protein QYF61_005811 [Mycteria americana]|uniref:Uncharacterized protein n=1 Tax=Mycteria americana TaxID=33587 RepID=A0AAN7MMH8_MYCAM|nr:hypothetical protein QYF61_005811 [Mycteria americana]
MSNPREEALEASHTESIPHVIFGDFQASFPKRRFPITALHHPYHKQGTSPVSEKKKLQNLLGSTGHSVAILWTKFSRQFYCDVPQVIKLACTDIYVVELLMVSNSGLLTILIFIVLIVSYAVILVEIRTHITEGKHKASSTCGAQVAIVSIHFVPCIFIYACPFKKLVVDKATLSLYTVITPMLNPIIYTLSNTEMKNAINRLLNIFFRMRNLQLSFFS